MVVEVSRTDERRDAGHIRESDVLEVFGELEVEGQRPALDQLIDDLTAHLASQWSRDTECEKRINEIAADEPQYAFVYCGTASIPKATVFLTRTGSRFQVTNIVPSDVSELSMTEYNQILTDFFERNVKQSAERLEVEVGSIQIRVAVSPNFMSDKAFELLRAFSGAANKGSGSSHPMDFDRWASFLTKIHRERANIDSDILIRWLIKNDWPEEIARRLAREFEFALRLLKVYDQSTV